MRRSIEQPKKGRSAGMSSVPQLGETCEDYQARTGRCRATYFRRKKDIETGGGASSSLQQPAIPDDALLRLRLDAAQEKAEQQEAAINRLEMMVDRLFDVVDRLAPPIVGRGTN